MRVLSCTFSLLGLLAVMDSGDASCLGQGRVRGLAEASEPNENNKRKNRRLMTNVGGGGGGFNTGGYPSVAEPNSGGSGGGTVNVSPPGGNTNPVSPPGGSSGTTTKNISPGGSTGGRAGGKGTSKSKVGGRSIKGSQGGFRGDNGSTGGRVENGFPTTAPASACTCLSCTPDALNAAAGEFTCGQRIDFLLTNNAAAFPTAATACYQIGGLEFPTECGACDPFTCDGRSEPVTEETHCGCATCTVDAWNIDADGYTCGARISWAMIVDQAQEEDACKLIVGLYPQCAPCNPGTCSLPVTAAPSIMGRSEPTLAPVTSAPVSAAPVTTTYAPVTAAPVTYAPATAAPVTAAPVTVAPTAGRSEPSVPTTPAPTFAPQTPAPQTAAPQTAAPVLPVQPDGTPAPTKECPEYCNCWSCSDAWANDANGLSCGARINWLIGTNIGEEAACRAVGGTEFATQCGACNPDTCDGRAETPVASPVSVPVGTPAPSTGRPQPATTPAPTTLPPVASPVVDTLAPTSSGMTPVPTRALPVTPGTPAPTTVQPVSTGTPTGARSEPTVSTGVPTAGRSEPTVSSPTTSDIYCFPPSSERRRYTGVWGDYMVEAKDSVENQVCDPVKNAFEQVLVSVDSSDELTLNYRYVNGLWYGSEVRIVRESGPFTYGTFSFSIKEIRVVENGTVVANVLPPGLVLGMFSWDPTYGGSDPEIYEIDIEVAQFGNASNPDAQFLLQPPQAPHFYRFETGSNGVCDQAPQKYEFTWLPTSIAWYSTAGGGQNLLYTTEQANAAGETDKVQCIPSTIEARINLWSIRSAGGVPDGMTESQTVQVVVDSFVFTPVDVSGVAAGEACSKNCQCLSDSCSSGVCQ